VGQVEHGRGDLGLSVDGTNGSFYMAQGRSSSKKEAGRQQGAKAGGEDEVYKVHFPGQAGRVDEMGE